jgi:eukaryotic-like serine/threonine-protein kinase
VPHPARIGRYDILGQLAVGGMAEILLGRLAGPSGFERLVVIKRILPHLAGDRRFVDMFLDEARTVARIHHPNVVPVHELGSDGDELFLVMEYLQGESVAGVLRRLRARDEPLEPWLALHIAAEACRGLHAAHELCDPDGVPLEVVHRDVSPQNIFVTYGGNVVVLDFGVARVADQQGRTEAGQVKGKTAYMSPEQCLARTLDRRSDVFSMGAVLFEMLTGTALFRRDADHATFKAICEEPIPRPSETRPGLPEDVDRVVARALGRQRGDRYATAAEMRADLHEAMQAVRRSGNADEALEAVMRGAFEERIEDKNELQRRARAGAPLGAVPPAEVDVEVQLPTVRTRGAVHAADESALRSVSDVKPGDAPGRSRRAALGWAAPLAVAAAVAGVVALATRTPGGGPGPDAAASAPSTSADTGAGTTATTTATAAAVDTAVTPAASTVRVRLETTPAGARIRVDGLDRGVTPAELELPRGSEPVRVTLEREGFQALGETVVPSTDQRIVLALRPLARAAARPAVRATGAASAPPAPTIEKLP